MMNIRAADYRKDLDEALARAVSADIGVAFATSAGLRFAQIERNLARLLEAGGAVRILLDLRMGITHPDFLQDVLGWQAIGLSVECRHYAAENGIFHPKLYVFRLENGTVRVITGSANWTGEAFSTNVEHGVVLEGNPTDVVIAGAQRFFDDLWDSDQTRLIDQRVLEAYQTYWRRRQDVERKARRRAGNAWRRLEERLTAVPSQFAFHWPSRDAAFLLGALAARGSLNRGEQSLTIEFRYGAANYRKGNIAFNAAEVVPIIPQTVAERIAPAVHPAVPSKTSEHSSVMPSTTTRSRSRGRSSKPNASYRRSSYAAMA